MFQDNTPNELCHLERPWDVKLPTFEFVLFHLFPHLTLEGKRDFSCRFGFLFNLIYGGTTKQDAELHENLKKVLFENGLVISHGKTKIFEFTDGSRFNFMGARKIIF